MASVWRAEDETLKRPVAIKLLYLGPQRDPRGVVEQFLREARIAAAVQHRNVIHTVDFGTTDDGVPFMVMELLQGESLADRMDRAPQLTMEEMVRIAELTLRGLAAVHEAGIVHRDLKPQNIFLQSDGETIYPKILDFGISRSLVASNQLASPVMTQQGMVIGTPHYMAPEQARGEAHIDKRADIYSMGAILYEGLTGRMPFDADNPGDLLVKILSTEALPIRALRPDLPEVIADCVSQAMARDREHRFIDAKAFRRALQSAADSAFPAQSNVRTSELPAVVQRASPRVQLQHAESTRLEASQKAWGDFEGLHVQPRAAGDMSHVAAAPTMLSAPAAAVHTAQAAPAVRASHAQPRAAAAPAAVTGARPRVASAARATVPDPEPMAFGNDGPMLGDNPLDVFSGAAAVDLELDVERIGGHSARLSPEPSNTNAAKQPRASRTSVAQATSSDRVVGRVARPSALWILPALLLLAFGLFLLAPAIVSEAPPDDAAAQTREAQNPATRSSSRRLQKLRPYEPGHVPPHLRELLD